MTDLTSNKKVLAIASHGGHWVQLNRLSTVFDKFNTTYCSTFKNDGFFEKPYHKVCDASMDNKFGLLLQFLQVFIVVLKVRPDVVISTGASVGFFAIIISKLFLSKTIWLDSIANGKEMSLSGKKVKKFADCWLTQWDDVAQSEGATYKGKVL